VHLRSVLFTGRTAGRPDGARPNTKYSVVYNRIGIGPACGAPLIDVPFSSAKKLNTPERNALSDDTVEAGECPKTWNQGLITRD
jgi:hypothetical protein